MLPRLVPLTSLPHLDDDELLERATLLRVNLTRRRSVRQFSNRTVSNAVIDACLRVAASAPSGANRQPWHFVVVQDPELRKKIRLKAEAEERAFYRGGAPDDWLEALAPLGTDENKPFLEEASHLIIVFAQRHGVGSDGDRMKHYYVQESVGIATGMLISALHQTGLASLTHTPSPMGVLRDILGSGENEHAFLILVTGYPADDAEVPVLEKKRLADVASFVE